MKPYDYLKAPQKYFNPMHNVQQFTRDQPLAEIHKTITADPFTVAPCHHQEAPSHSAQKSVLASKGSWV